MEGGGPPGGAMFLEELVAPVAMQIDSHRDLDTYELPSESAEGGAEAHVASCKRTSDVRGQGPSNLLGAPEPETGNLHLGEQDLLHDEASRPVAAGGNMNAAIEPPWPWNELATYGVQIKQAKNKRERRRATAKFNGVIESAGFDSLEQAMAALERSSANGPSAQAE